MKIEDIKVGDVVAKTTGKGNYIITSVNPVRGLPQYVTIMDEFGHADDVWVNFLKERLGHININYIFQQIKNAEFDDERSIR